MIIKVISKTGVCFCAFLIFTLAIGCYGNKQIIIDGSLHNNSFNWEATKKGDGSAIGKTHFGPYKMIRSTKLDSAKLKTKSYSFWDLHLSASNEIETERKVYSIDVTHTKDTAKVLLYIKITNYLHFPGLFSVLDDETDNEKKEANGKIVINGIIEPWEFFIYPYGRQNFRYYNTTGMLWNKNDTIMVGPISDFKNVNQSVIFLAHTKGIMLKQKEETIAALQLLGKNYVWIRKDLPNDTEFAIASLFSTILCTMDK